LLLDGPQQLPLAHAHDLSRNDFNPSRSLRTAAVVALVFDDRGRVRVAMA